LVRVSTYTLLGLRDFNEARHAEAKFDLGAFARTWVYVYMGYNAKL
jgi:protein transport protein SEC24